MSGWVWRKATTAGARNRLASGSAAVTRTVPAMRRDRESIAWQTASMPASTLGQRKQVAAGLVEGVAGPPPVEEGEADRPFERADPADHRRLAGAELAGGAEGRARPRHREKQP